ncbi:MAG: hypothetical protein HC803_09630 [Saprospiraceae bacterium]|nr:hypothetical protein [Saprospiraceae bacterium]
MKNLIRTTLKTSLALLLLVSSVGVSFASQTTQIVGFDVEDFNIGNMLTWQTTVEVDNKEFVIQRSIDGANFTTIGTVDGTGTTVDKQSYSFLDLSADKGITRYRLKQVNYDGAFVFSNIIKIDKSGANNLTITSITPLEQGGMVEVVLDVKKPSTVTYNVSKLDFYLVYTATQTLQTGKNIISVDVSDFEEGTYQITIEGDKESESIIFKNTKKKNMRTFADFDDGKMISDQEMN